MLSHRTKYGLKALLRLARESSTTPVLVADIARAERIPRRFLEAILLDLKRRGFVKSKKGKAGGYALARPAGDIRVGEVVRALEGPLAAVGCVSQIAYSACADCVDEQTCGIRFAMKQVRDATAGILDGMTLVDVNKASGAGTGR
jgi:Rrf2 family protein